MAARSTFPRQARSPVAHTWKYLSVARGHQSTHRTSVHTLSGLDCRSRHCLYFCMGTVACWHIWLLGALCLSLQVWELEPRANRLRGGMVVYLPSSAVIVFMYKYMCGTLSTPKISTHKHAHITHTPIPTQGKLSTCLGKKTIRGIVSICRTFVSNKLTISAALSQQNLLILYTQVTVHLFTTDTPGTETPRQLSHGSQLWFVRLVLCQSHVSLALHAPQPGCYLWQQAPGQSESTNGLYPRGEAAGWAARGRHTPPLPFWLKDSCCPWYWAGWLAGWLDVSVRLVWCSLPNVCCVWGVARCCCAWTKSRQAGGQCISWPWECEIP